MMPEQILPVERCVSEAFRVVQDLNGKLQELFGHC